MYAAARPDDPSTTATPMKVTASVAATPYSRLATSRDARNATPRPATIPVVTGSIPERRIILTTDGVDAPSANRIRIAAALQRLAAQHLWRSRPAAGEHRDLQRDRL